MIFFAKLYLFLPSHRRPSAARFLRVCHGFSLWFSSLAFQRASLASLQERSTLVWASVFPGFVVPSLAPPPLPTSSETLSSSSSAAAASISAPSLSGGWCWQCVLFSFSLKLFFLIIIFYLLVLFFTGVLAFLSFFFLIICFVHFFLLFFFLLLLLYSCCSLPC